MLDLLYHHIGTAFVLLGDLLALPRELKGFLDPGESVGEGSH